MTYHPNQPPTTPLESRPPTTPTRPANPQRSAVAAPRRSSLPSVGWLAVLFLGSLSLLMMSWGAYSLTPKALEKDLHGGRASPKLSIAAVDATIGKGRAAADLEPVELAFLDQQIELPPLPAPVPPPLPAPEPVKTQLPPPPPPPAPLPKVELPQPITEPLPLVTPPAVLTAQATIPIIPEYLPPFMASSIHLGDTPMTRSWKMLAFYSLFASAFSQTPALAGEKDKILESIKATVEGTDADVKAIKKSMDSVKKDIGKLQGDFTLLSAQVDDHKSKFKDLEKQIKDLQLRVGLLASSPAAAADKAGMDDIKQKLGSIEQAILRLQPGEKRTSFSGPGPASAGRIILANLYGERLLFTINGKNYVVEANTTLPIEGVPAGNLTYEVRSPTWGLRAQAVANLKADETFTLTAR